MEITFEGHEPAVRTIEPSPIDLLNFKDTIKSLALNVVENYSWDGPYYPKEQRDLVELCEKFGVDCTFKQDRVAFVNALLELI